MNTITRRLASRITLVERRRVACIRPDHHHKQPYIDVLTFTVDGVNNVWIECANPDSNLYHVKIGDWSDLFKTEGQIIRILENL